MVCQPGDGSPCQGPYIVEACHLEPELDTGIPEVILTGPEDQIVSVTEDYFSFSWEGELETDTLEILLVGVDTHGLISKTYEPDIDNPGIGGVYIPWTPDLEVYSLFVRRVRDGKVSRWTTEVFSWIGTPSTYVTEDFVYVAEDGEYVTETA